MLKRELPTPSLLVEEKVLRNNIAKMARAAAEAGVVLRPHIKTHKNIKIAKMQLAEGAQGITCATVGEAAVMAEGGIQDIFLAYPLFGDYQLQQAADLSKKCNLTVAFDSLAACKRLSYFAKLNETTFKLALIVNTGGNRDGVLPEEALELALAVKDLPGLVLVGVMTHEGHVLGSADTASMIEAAEKSQVQLVRTAEILQEAGLQLTVVSSGSTPACQGEVAVAGITEWRPGTYVFNDLNEMKFIATKEDCALKILATVVSNPAPGRYILDAGSKVLSEARDANYGHGLILSQPEARLEKVNEEHGIVQAEQGSFRLGEQVEIIPVHVCTVVNLSNGFYLAKENQEVEYWPIDARGLVW